MSKNVAVFVDVANIFYAAKAGGVDIDYVTLLKSATAGRDFVRAYAYTGLDPENENQRQFHAFLARSGYKVVSKDIRKYGDGRIKANLDIELVVDMMRLARNLDIAVVVSGDGDFAPAIRAVQEMGVRVEVISFRGNTSADLIEVADQFTDIAQIARVDKTSGRSGRRVAAEGDLSMTAVPEKETEGAPRRRRGRAAAERERERDVADTGAGALPGNLIVLPGERLSRAPDAPDAADDDEGEELAGAVLDDGADGEGAERRRRRRRGGRGRGRGRRDDARPVSGELDRAPVGDEDDEEYAAQPAAPPRHAFGSVWDSQIGLPSAPSPAAGLGYSDEPTDEDDDLDEPEVPEYLLAERRQRQRGGGGRRIGRGGRAGAYQAAIERERYGRGGGSGPGGGGFGGQRIGERPRQDRQRGRGGPPQRQGRPDRQPDQRPVASSYSAPSGEPWSEVPAELEELLRQEVLRRADRHEPAGTNGNDGGAGSAAQPSGAAPVAEPDEAKPRRTTRRSVAATDDAGDDKPKRTTRSRANATSTDETASAGEAEAKPKRAARSRPAAPATADAADEKPRRATRSRKKSDEAPAEG